jgi:methylenetetrahydrofolate--tRNA-(uracil-5-)-methyltransferase
MNVNFGLFPPLGYEPPRKAARPTKDGGLGPRNSGKKQALCARALNDLDGWIAAALPHAAE